MILLRKLCFMALLCAFGPLITSAQESADAANEAKTRETVLQLIQDLSHSSIDQRDTAVRRLIALGPVALPTVRGVLENQDLQGEAEVRLTQVFEELQQLSMADFLRETTVSLSGSFSLSTTIEKLSSLSANSVTLEATFDADHPEPKVIVDFQNETFWKAIDSLCDKNDLMVVPYTDEQSILLRPGKPFGLPRTERGQYNGPFRIEAVSVASSRSFENPSMDGLRTAVQISWEPRLRPLFFEVDKASLLAECDDGAILESLDDGQLEFSPSLPTTAEFEIGLALPPRSSKSISRLTGKLIASIPSEPVKIKFKDLDKRVTNERRVGSIIASIEDARLNGEVIQVDLLLKLNDPEMRLDSFRNWLLLNEAYAIDGEGNHAKNFGWQTYLMNDQEIGITVNFEKRGELSDYQFVFTAPAALIEHPIEFILEDIPLP